MKRFIWVSVCVLLVGSGVSLGDFDVAPGWDLFMTQPGSNFMGYEWEGVPLGTFNFGGTIGVQATGATDTIMKRIDQATVLGLGQTATIDIELVALQLKSVDPIDLGAGLGFHFATLQPGNPSTGTMDITFESEYGGRFDSAFNLLFDIRFGALDGPIIWSAPPNPFPPMVSVGNPWSRTPPNNGAVIIERVNRFLKGPGLIDQDFWPGTDPARPGEPPMEVPHDASGAGHHIVSIIPEPASMSLLALGGLALLRRKRS